MLELVGLTKHYGTVVALDDLSLRARPGRLLGFLGPNGAGKTTAMRAVFGLIRLDAGTVRWQGGQIRDRDRLRFGYMPEARGLYPRMPTAAQLAYLGKLHGLRTAAAAAASRRWLAELGLSDRAGTAVSALSHGNQQRVQLAAALVHDPDLLVLDEPFSGLDPLGVAAMSTVLRDRAAAGATVVFSSHQLDLVEELCDDVVIVAQGRQRAVGTLEEVRRTGYQRVAVRLAGGRPAAPPAEAEVIDNRDGLVRMRAPANSDPRVLLEHFATQGRVERFALEPPPLSEVFRDVVGVSVAAAEQGRTGAEQAPAAEQETVGQVPA